MLTILARVFAACGLVVLVAGCGGGHGGSSASSSSAPTSSAPATQALSNFTSLVVDSGPSSLTTAANGYATFNFSYVTVTLCAPGSTTNCQTIDHVQLDTGSVGLRIPKEVLNASLLAALPVQTDPSGNPVGECYGYVDGYAFGAVRQTDFRIGGETVAGMPMQIIGDAAIPNSAPAACSAGGGSNFSTVEALGANGIIGVGTTTTDCGSACATGGYAAAVYYDCPSSGCGAMIARAANTTAPFQQVLNPVAAMAVNNNGVIVSLPALPSTGVASVVGTLYFGIGTQTNNGLGSASVIPASLSTSPNGSGLFSATYKGQTLADSYIDSGSSSYLFADNSIPGCTGTDYVGYYCPASSTNIQAALQTNGGGSANVSLALNNAQSLLSTDDAALPGLGGNPSALKITDESPSSFDFGLPFFYGRNVYTAIEGRSAGGVTGPYYAF